MMRLKRVFHNAIGGILGRWWATPALPVAARSASARMPALPSGFSALDRALGGDGLPQGRLSELTGSDARGVTSVAAAVAARLQRRQVPVTVVDVAGNFDAAHAARCGLSAPELLCHVPDSAVTLVGLVAQAARQRGLVVVNLGSPRRTFAGADGGLLRLLLQRLRRIARSSESAFLYLTLLPEADPFLHTNYPPGFPLHDAADVRLWVQDAGWIRRKSEVGGYRGVVTVIRNRLGPEGQSASLRIPFTDPALVQLADELGF